MSLLLSRPLSAAIAASCEPPFKPRSMYRNRRSHRYVQSFGSYKSTQSLTINISLAGTCVRRAPLLSAAARPPGSSLREYVPALFTTQHAVHGMLMVLSSRSSIRAPLLPSLWDAQAIVADSAGQLLLWVMVTGTCLAQCTLCTIS